MGVGEMMNQRWRGNGGSKVEVLNGDGEGDLVSLPSDLPPPLPLFSPLSSTILFSPLLASAPLLCFPSPPSPSLLYVRAAAWLAGDSAGRHPW